MAGFLNGLLGALKGLGSGDQPAPTGSGGLLEGLVAAAPRSDLGDFRLSAGPGGVSSLPADASTPYVAAPARPGFLDRINTRDDATGMSAVDKWDRFGGMLMDLDDGGDRAAKADAAAAGRAATTKNKALMAQIDQLFADDPRMRFLLKANPEAATKALADVYKSANETRVVGEGSAVGDGAGAKWTAPKYGVQDGYGYQIGPGGVDWGDQRGQTHQEAETERHNRRSEDLGFGNLDVARGNLGVAQGNLGVSRERLNFDRFKDGRDAGSAGGGGDLSSMSTADLIAALRGAR